MGRAKLKRAWGALERGFRPPMVHFGAAYCATLGKYA